MNAQHLQKELQQTQTKLERHQAALRLAHQEIQNRNKGIRALTAYTYQSRRANSQRDLFQLTLNRALETTQTQVGAIILIQPDAQNLTIGIERGLTEIIKQILVGQRFDYGATALMPHLVIGNAALLEYHSTNDAEERRLLQAGGLSSLVSLPLQAQKQLLGACSSAGRKKQPFL